jgi:hypothetical protein
VVRKEIVEVCTSEEKTYLIAKLYCAGQLDGFQDLLEWVIDADARKR